MSLQLTTIPLRNSCRRRPCNSACHWLHPHNNAPPDIVTLQLTTIPLRKSCRRRLCNSACHWSRPRRNVPPGTVRLRLTMIPLRKSCRRRPCTGSRTRPQKTRRYQLYIVPCHWLRPHNNAPPDRLSLPLTMILLRRSCRWRPCNSACYWLHPHNNVPPDIVTLQLTTIPLRKSCRRRPCKADTRHYLGSSCRWRCMYQRHTMKDWDTVWQDHSRQRWRC